MKLKIIKNNYRADGGDDDFKAALQLVVAAGLALEKAAGLFKNASKDDDPTLAKKAAKNMDIVGKSLKTLDTISK